MAKAAKKINIEDVINEKPSEFDALREQVNEKLEEAMNKFTAVAIVGVTEDGGFDFITNVSQYSYIQWLVNKASFELFIHEKNASARSKEENS